MKPSMTGHIPGLDDVHALSLCLHSNMEVARKAMAKSSISIVDNVSLRYIAIFQDIQSTVRHTCFTCVCTCARVRVCMCAWVYACVHERERARVWV